MKDFVLATFKLEAEAEAALARASEAAEKAQQRAELVASGGVKETIQAYSMRVIDILSQNPNLLLSSVGCVVLGFMYIILFGGQNTQVETRLAAAAEAADAARLAARETDAAERVAPAAAE